MKPLEFGDELIDEIKGVLARIEDAQVQALAQEIRRAKAVFVAGAGRSGLCVKAFAMRMMHLDLDVYAVGEVVTPNLEESDLLILGSGSGSTRSMVLMAEMARQVGARVALVTMAGESAIGRLADCRVIIPADQYDGCGESTSIQPEGSLFEQCLYLVLDIVILKLIALGGIDKKHMFAHHANLE